MSEGLRRQPEAWGHGLGADVIAEWLGRNVAGFTPEQIADARRGIVDCQPRWLMNKSLVDFGAVFGGEQC